MVGHGIAHPLEVVETVLEVADVAWRALEYRREHKLEAEEDDDISHLRDENLRLRSRLAENLTLLKGLSQSPSFSNDCPPDLYLRLVATVDSSSFQTQLESLHQESAVTKKDSFPFREATEADLDAVEVLVKIDNGEPSYWVWITNEMVPGNVEELSGIDNENYVVVSEENVVDGIANFIARCILANPKSQTLTPAELQKTVTRALGGMNNLSKLSRVWEAGKIIYALSTWGIALAGIYRHRAILKVAARGVGASTKFVMKAL